MIRLLFALLLSGYVLSTQIDPEIGESASPAPPEKLDTTIAEKPVQSQQESDLETEPSVWFSYHHSVHSIPPQPLIIPRPRVYATYYANYAPYPYWIW